MDHENRPLSVTSHANVNIALLKYWGKKDELLKIPYQSSLSLSLDDLGTTTTITLDDTLTSDQLFLAGQRANPDEEIKMIKYLNLVRQLYGCRGYVKIDSTNSVPTAAGLASSASAYASIALGLNRVYNLNLNQEGLSKLARLGSGSAARSIYGGFAFWHHGESHETSYASPLPSTWDDLMFIIVLISGDKKKISSREAMAQSVLLPSYQDFVTSSEALVAPMLQAIAAKDLNRLGPLIEQSSDLLHHTIRQTGIDYYLPQTYELLKKLIPIKAKYPLFYTIDAGPNVKLLTRKQYVSDITKALSDYHLIVTGIGKDAYVRD